MAWNKTSGMKHEYMYNSMVYSLKYKKYIPATGISAEELINVSKVLAELLRQKEEDARKEAERLEQERLRKERQEAERLRQQQSSDYRDLYAVLGVRIGASPPEIRTAYFRLAKENHPDRFLDPLQKQAAEDRMKRINVARDTLTKLLS